MNQNIVDYYQTVRQDKALQAAYAGCENFDQIIEKAVDEGRKLGFSFTKEEALAAGMNFKALCSQAANDDELTEFELEMISAGSISPGKPIKPEF